MKHLLTIILSLTSFISFAQDSFYDIIKLGKYNVGFCDSLIYCENQFYDQYEYAGGMPLFLVIWHPIEEKTDLQPLAFREFRNRSISSTLASVYKPLCLKMDSSFVWYNIVEDFVDFDSINYGQFTYFNVLDTLKNYKTKSYFNRIKKKSNYPVIIYHHGDQGLSDENFILAEYFASRGYIVVSSNYHLPYENYSYGSSGGSENDWTELPKRVTQFARTLTTSNEIYFIGHSMGAQKGFKYLYQTGWANAFVSLETTLELWDSTKIKSSWPELSKLIKLHEKDYSIPILMIANTRKDKPFEFFTGITNTNTIHASAKEEFGHESYTAIYFLRYLYQNRFAQPDVKELKAQLDLYNEHLRLIECFITSVREKTEFDKDKFKEKFFINSYNTNANKK